jgi:hypothetical protein
LTLSFVKVQNMAKNWSRIKLARNYSSGIFHRLLQFVLEHGQQDDWFNNKLIVLLSAVSVFGVILFIWRQLTYKYP